MSAAATTSTTRTAVTTRKATAARNRPGIAVELLTAGSAACVADLFTFPLDTAKVRLQIQGETGATLKYSGVYGTVSGIARNEGARALYSGIVPGLQRQMAFSAIRLGAYERVRNYYMDATGLNSGVGLLFVRIAAGVTTGTLAILSAQPTDVVKIRMQADVRAPGEAARYRGVMHAYKDIAAKEGVAGLYKGTLPNIARTAIINVGEIVVYDAVKDTLISSRYMEDGMPCYLTAALAAGFTATLIASPVDVIKTRFMNSPTGAYRGAFHCAVQTFRGEGVSAFYKGFNASFSRLVAWNVCLWLTYEQFKKAASSFYN